MVDKLRNNMADVSFCETGGEAAGGTFQAFGQHRAAHCKSAYRAVNLMLDFTVRESLKQNSAIFRKVFGNHFAANLLCEIVTFSFKIAKVFLKPFIVLGEKIDTLFEQGDVLPENGCTASLGDELVKLRKE
jgi:hypothetical protein